MGEAAWARLLGMEAEEGEVDMGKVRPESKGMDPRLS
jgi:hypothetical protein